MSRSHGLRRGLSTVAPLALEQLRGRLAGLKPGTYIDCGAKEKIRTLIG